ncbi:MAG: DUF3326 domain-containing protein [Prochlorothrix sp.]|nr:DUF3326 domain-containing protein [Prochlorothrix sp.]
MGFRDRPYTAVLIIPTGIGCAMGGYAGDALPVARALASGVDRLITHPNVLNGAQLYWPLDNTWYVEGYALDQFAAGRLALEPVRQNRVGLLLDAAIEPELRLRHLQAADAARATLGLHLTDYVVTDRPLSVRLNTSEIGASWGVVEPLDSLLRAAEKLVTEAGAEAIAVVARFPDEEPDSPSLQNYRQGQGVDPIAGAEAVISHFLVRSLHIPCAHAPALAPLPPDPDLSPRSAAEELGHTFLPCVLVGLSRAPRYHVIPSSATPPPCVPSPTLTTGAAVDVVIVPESACGGAAVLHWASQGKTIVAVQENQTALQVPPAALGISAVTVASYWEALGYVMADRAGVDPWSLRPQSRSLRAWQPPTGKS